MFEHYTEAARRVIFFARYETSMYGGDEIGMDDLKMGYARENQGLGTLEELRKLRGEPAHERVSTSVELPLSRDVKEVLNAAAEKAESAGSDKVSAAHLLLAIQERYP